jgi:hypothetical protein
MAAIIGDFLGIGRTLSTYTAEDLARINEIINSGLHQFYFPSVLINNQLITHSWSFLKKSMTITTTSSASDYDLPDDFGGFIGKLNFAEDEAFESPSYVSPDKILQLRQFGTFGSQAPNLFSIITKSSTPSSSAGQRFQLMLHPDPDGVYHLSGYYNVIPNKMAEGSAEYPYGSAAHRETLLESCLAIAEQRMNDEAGIHTDKFGSLIQASIGYDRKFNDIEFLGYNGDRSSRSFTNSSITYVTYEGTRYPS